MTDKAIAWVRQQRSLMTDKPFFAYFAPGATHAPHHVAAEWSDKYKGRFDAGWDALRDEIFARQKELGVIPADADSPPARRRSRPGTTCPTILKPVLARQMEVYAGFLEHTDHHVGRVIDALEELEVLDDTLIYYIIGDNGASAEGTPNGTFNELFSLNGAAAFETAEFMAAHIDEFGTPEAYNHYAVGWAHAMCTPYQWTKQVASHFGGTRNGTIVHWPNGFEAQRRDPPPVPPRHRRRRHRPGRGRASPSRLFVNGIEQQPLHGVSMAYCFDDADAADRRETQYFEMVCNRGIYHKGWMAVTRHSVPWLFGADLPALDDDVWELYDTTTDWTQAHDLAAEHPDMLAAPSAPVPHRGGEVPGPSRSTTDGSSGSTRTWPDGRSWSRAPSQLLFGGMGRLTEHSVLNLKNKSYTVTADIDVPEGGGQRCDRRPRRRLRRLVASTSTTVCRPTATTCSDSTGSKPPGTSRSVQAVIRSGSSSPTTEDGLAKGGDTTLFVDGTKVGSARQEASIPMLFSGDETLDVGVDYGHVGQRRLRTGHQPVHRHRQLGPTRPRCGRSLTSDQPRGPALSRDGEAVVERGRSPQPRVPAGGVVGWSGIIEVAKAPPSSLTLEPPN